ncbi:hypothetical protein B1R94_28670 [Mycolicibacterium litorale]|nr:hypothetical protein B1R94_28670 [Mycolicibacterium litorale]
MTFQAIEIPENSAVFGETRNAFTRFGYSAAVRSHGHLFISGTIGRRADGSIADTVQEQTELALTRIHEILRLADLTPAALVDVVSYHVDIHHHLAGFLEVKQRLVEAPYPAWSMIGVSGLAVPGLLVEIRATAAYP